MDRIATVNDEVGRGRRENGRPRLRLRGRDEGPTGTEILYGRGELRYEVALRNWAIAVNYPATVSMREAAPEQLSSKGCSP